MKYIGKIRGDEQLCSLTVAKKLLTCQGFQYLSSVPVLHYLQVILFIKIRAIFLNILYNTLKN